MPRSKEENQRIREARIRAIRDATIRVYASKGFLGAQMDDIAKEAGLAKGLLYYYFKSKHDLFQFVFEDLMEQAFRNARAMAAPEPEVGLAQSLEAFIRFLVSAGFERPVYPLVYKMMPEDLEHVFPDDAAEVQKRFFDQFTKPMIDRFAAAMDSGEIPRGNPMLQTLLFTSGVLTVSHQIAVNPAIARGKGKEEVIEETKIQLFYGVFGQEEHRK